MTDPDGDNISDGDLAAGGLTGSGALSPSLSPTCLAVLAVLLLIFSL